MNEARRTQVGIIGSGPAGLFLSHFLHLHGIHSIILESRSREYIESRVRAGVLEQGTVDLMVQTGVGSRLKREGLVHGGVEFAFSGRRHRFDFVDLIGRSITVYAQHEVIKDLVSARLSAGGEILFEAEAVGVEGVSGTSPEIVYRHNGEQRRIACDFVAGCDGFHGVSRLCVPEAIKTYERIYPFAWLGILAMATRLCVINLRGLSISTEEKDTARSSTCRGRRF